MCEEEFQKLEAKEKEKEREQKQMNAKNHFLVDVIKEYITRQ